MRPIPLFLTLSLLLLAACNRETAESSDERSAVSLSPAATDLILAMESADLLKGVSTYDQGKELAAVPFVGDYENVDWERIASIKPSLMFVQSDPSRLPPGMQERAAKLGIELVILRIDRLTDIIVELDRIGTALGRTKQARELLHRIRQQLEEVRTNVSAKPRVRTLLVVGLDGPSVAGRETFLDDLLEIAGGVNVVEAKGYVTIDREKVLELAPDAIVVFKPILAPGDSQAIDIFIRSVENTPAVHKGRTVYLSGPNVLKPGPEVGDVARQIAAGIHGK